MGKLKGSQLQVLVADDDRTGAEILARSFERWEYVPHVVADGAAAWQYLRSVTTPTLAVLDWVMPELNGPDVCRRLRSERPDANVYLMLLTAVRGRDGIVAGLDAGADDYIMKPFDQEELRARIAVGVRVLELRARLSERVAELETALWQVKYLQGLLPICSYCRRVRDDNRYWQSVEDYVVKHSDARFSHGICPQCFEAAEKELDEFEKREVPLE